MTSSASAVSRSRFGFGWPRADYRVFFYRVFFVALPSFLRLARLHPDVLRPFFLGFFSVGFRFAVGLGWRRGAVSERSSFVFKKIKPLGNADPKVAVRFGFVSVRRQKLKNRKRRRTKTTTTTTTTRNREEDDDDGDDERNRNERKKGIEENGRAAGAETPRRP